jgi:hypothetical protein
MANGKIINLKRFDTPWLAVLLTSFRLLADYGSVNDQCAFITIIWISHLPYSANMGAESRLFKVNLLSMKVWIMLHPRKRKAVSLFKERLACHSEIGNPNSSATASCIEMAADSISLVVSAQRAMASLTYQLFTQAPWIHTLLVIKATYRRFTKPRRVESTCDIEQSTNKASSSVTSSGMP